MLLDLRLSHTFITLATDQTATVKRPALDQLAQAVHEERKVYTREAYRIMKNGLCRNSYLT